MTMLIRRAPREGVPFASVLDRFFAEPFFGEGGAMSALEEGTLALDVSENETSVKVRASLPGFTKDDVQIDVHEGVLSISATHEETEEVKEEKYYRKERRVGSVSRRVALPCAVDETKAEAELKDGVLTLTLPKSASATPKRVKIK